MEFKNKTDVKQRFEDKLHDLINAKCHNNNFTLFQEEYTSLIANVKITKSKIEKNITELCLGSVTY